MLVYLTTDPDTGRVTAQDRPFTRADFPRGVHGVGWPRRTCDVPKQTWTKMRRGTLPPDAQDRHHRAWWADGTPEVPWS